MVFRRIPHDDLGCASQTIGDEKAGLAAVVDPRFEGAESLEPASPATPADVHREARPSYESGRSLEI